MEVYTRAEVPLFHQPPGSSGGVATTNMFLGFMPTKNSEYIVE
jgi:hypothetical protein